MSNTTTETTKSDTTDRKFIPRPETLEAEIEQLHRQLTDLRAMLKISKRAYGVKDE